MDVLGDYVIYMMQQINITNGENILLVVFSTAAYFDIE